MPSRPYEIFILESAAKCAAVKNMRNGIVGERQSHMTARDSLCGCLAGVFGIVR